MNTIKLSFSQNKQRYLFTLLGFMIAGIAMIFSLFYTSSIRQNIAKSLPLKKGEVHAFVNEENYLETPVNYYKKLEENFEVVIPFVKTDRVFNNQTYGIIGTDVSGKKLMIDNEFLDYEIVEALETSTDNPKILIHEALRNDIENQIIKLNESNFEVSGIYRFVDEDKNEPFKNNFILSLNDYSSAIDPNILSDDSGITKFVIKDYYLKTSLANQTAVEKIISVYGAADVRYYVGTYDSLLQKEMDQFLLFTSIPVTFFILIMVFSVLNLFVAIKLTIRERKHFYTVLITLGMRIRQLKKMILLELLFISIIAAAASLILGVAVSAIVIAATKELSFVMAPAGLILLVLLSMIIVPIIQALISVQFIKYRHIIN